MKEQPVGQGPDSPRLKKWTWWIKTLLMLFQVISVGGELSPRQQAENFLHLVSTNEIDKAFDGLLVRSVVLVDRKRELDLMRSRLKTGVSQLGKPGEFELVSEKNAGSSISHLTYLFRFEKQPMVCDFYFYRPREHWMIDELNFDLTFASAPARPKESSAASSPSASPSGTKAPGKAKSKSSPKPSPAKKQ